MANQQVFIALQCFDCSTMQVKQQKKSSNKWVCAVCNQKQSVRKMFARSCLAKDVREFVQKFNMARSLPGDSATLVPHQISADAAAGYEDTDRCSSNPCGREDRSVPRIDWSQYLDADEEEYAVDDGTFADVTLVTEMPPGNSIKRTFSKFPPKRNLREEDPKRKILEREQKNGPGPQVRGGKRRRLPAGRPSKWSEYLREDDASDMHEAGGADPDCDASFNRDLQGETTGVPFDEEVHPDFL